MEEVHAVMQDKQKTMTPPGQDYNNKQTTEFSVY